MKTIYYIIKQINIIQYFIAKISQTILQILHLVNCTIKQQYCEKNI